MKEVENHHWNTEAEIAVGWIRPWMLGGQISGQNFKEK